MPIFKSGLISFSVHTQGVFIYSQKQNLTLGMFLHTIFSWLETSYCFKQQYFILLCEKICIGKSQIWGLFMKMAQSIINASFSGSKKLWKIILNYHYIQYFLYRVLSKIRYRILIVKNYFFPLCFIWSLLEVFLQLLKFSPWSPYFSFILPLYYNYTYSVCIFLSI